VKESSAASSDGNELVSVIIAAYNEATAIRDCLTSLVRQTYQPLEVILVDDGSTDGTVAAAQDVAGVQIVSLGEHRGAGAARNEGSRRARGHILVFLDGDMYFPPHFIEKLVAPILVDGEPGSFTKEIYVANPNRRWARAHQIGRGLPPHCHFPAGFPDRWETFRAIRRDLFDSVGGFDEIGHGEDVTLGRKLGLAAVAAPGAECWHYEPDTLREIFSSARWYGRGERVLELSRPLRRYAPDRSLARGVRFALRHKMPSLLLYRLVWDAGVIAGLLTRGEGRSAK
jgi:glycosyltransferase involved in cell wall biosynthesis